MASRARTILLACLVGVTLLLGGFWASRTPDRDAEQPASVSSGAAPTRSASPVAVVPIDPKRAEVRPLEKPANAPCPADTATLATHLPDGSSSVGCGKLDAQKQLVREGDWSFVDAEQLTYAGKFADGKKVGSWVLWSASGNPIRTEPYVDGTLNGVQLEWSEDGRRVAERPFKDGALEGTVVFNRPDGTVVRERWHAGQRIEPFAAP